MPLMAAVGCMYASLIVRQPATEVYTAAMSAFGITAALTAVCLSATVPTRYGSTAPVLGYAGEKFLHATILLVQVIFLVFARDYLLPDGHLRLVRRVVQVGANAAALWVITAATWCWYWALDALNDELWSNWQKNVDATNAAMLARAQAGDNGTD